MALEGFQPSSQEPRRSPPDEPPWSVRSAGRVPGRVVVGWPRAGQRVSAGPLCGSLRVLVSGACGLCGSPG